MTTTRRPITISVFQYAGSFGGDKDAAAKVRDTILKPALKDASTVIAIDFVDVEFVTQSFAHALLSAIIRKDAKSLERMTFTNCSESVREIIEIVVQYSQETWPAN